LSSYIQIADLQIGSGTRTYASHLQASTPAERLIRISPG